MNKNFLVVLGIFLAVVVAGIFLIRKPKTQPPVSGTPASGVVETETNQDTDIREVSVVASEYSFKPSTLTLAKGEKVRLTLTNEGRMEHDLVIDGLNIRTDMVSPGESDTIEFTVPESGELTYYCSISNHRALGMEGKITIEQ